jgi:hypothetical protein
MKSGFAAIAAAGLLPLALAASATAGSLLTHGQLTPVYVEGSVALGAGVNNATLSGAGVANLPAGILCTTASGIPNSVYGCSPPKVVSWGTGSLSATLGNDPTLAVAADNDADPLATGGGGAFIIMRYGFAYVNAGALTGTTFVADLRSSDSLFVSGDAIASATLTVQKIDGAAYTQKECLTVAGTNGCGVRLHTGAPFLANDSLTLLENTPYEVDLEVNVTTYFTYDIYDPTAPSYPGIANASIDPKLTTTAHDGGTLISAPG